MGNFLYRVNVKSKILGISVLLGGVVLGAVTYFNNLDGPGGLDFHLKDRSGMSVRLADFRGHVVLVHFWASWCEPCVEEIPQLVDFAKAEVGRPFRLVLMSNDSSWEEAETVLPNDGLPETVVALLDPQTQVAERFGSYQLPETYILGRDGNVITKWIGQQDWSNEEIRASVRKLY